MLSLAESLAFLASCTGRKVFHNGIGDYLILKLTNWNLWTPLPAAAGLFKSQQPHNEQSSRLSTDNTIHSKRLTTPL